MNMRNPQGRSLNFASAWLFNDLCSAEFLPPFASQVAGFMPSGKLS
jgi:hypothetical protein